MATAETLVLGLGNPLRGDDGVGPAIAAWLQKHGAPPGVDVVDDGAAGIDLVSTWAGYRRVFIVDAANMARAPGEWVRFTPDTARLENGESSGMTLHNAGLADALALGATLGLLPEHVVIYGVQPARLDWSPELSAEVQAAVPAVGYALLQDIGGQHGKDSDH